MLRDDNKRRTRHDAPYVENIMKTVALGGIAKLRHAGGVGQNVMDRDRGGVMTNVTSHY